MTEQPNARPNRWAGPPSTWRTYTREERNIATSLDTLRSQDLSIHLYNAFAIKARVRNAKRNGKGKAKSTGYHGNQGDDFVPPDVWTAWPMPVDEVPTESYLPKTGGKGAMRMDEDVRPSAGLEEALLATTTRIARERWVERRWEWRGSKNEVNVKNEGIADDSAREQAAGSEEEDGEELPGRPMFSSQAFDALAQASSSEEEQKGNADDEEAEIERRPVPLADDDRARRLLLPSVRHIISKADDLLMGLQKAREAYAGNWNKSARSNSTTSGDKADTDADTSRGQSASPKSRKRARASSFESESSMVSTRSDSSRGRRKPQMKQLKLRDWSDVLGMAALTGWDPDVLERAAKRCSRLFGEDMIFRTFKEDEGEERSFFIEKLASGKEPDDSAAEEAEEEEMAVAAASAMLIPLKKLEEGAVMQSNAIRCPVTTCPGHRMVYARATNMYNHVRTYHPEVDIEALKKLTAKKGERRGKHDRGSRGPEISTARVRRYRSRQRSLSVAIDSSQ